MEEDVYMNFKNGEAPALNDENLNQLQKLIKNDFEELEQKYNSIRQFTETEYRSDGKIEITSNSGIYLLYIVTSRRWTNTITFVNKHREEWKYAILGTRRNA